MVNKLKFRIWNPKFQDFDYWGFLSDQEFQSPKTHFFTIEGARDNSRQIKPFSDKNGKEVYDDDVVRIKRRNLMSGEEDPTFYHTIIITPDITEISKGDIMSELISFEVVGNIYQNQEYVKHPVQEGK